MQFVLMLDSKERAIIQCDRLPEVDEHVEYQDDDRGIHQLKVQRRKSLIKDNHLVNQIYFVYD